MDGAEFKEIIKRIVDRLEKQDPETACVFSDCDCDCDCDMILYYGIMPTE